MYADGRWRVERCPFGLFSVLNEDGGYWFPTHVSRNHCRSNQRTNLVGKPTPVYFQIEPGRAPHQINHQPTVLEEWIQSIDGSEQETLSKYISITFELAKNSKRRSSWLASYVLFPCLDYSPVGAR